MRYRVLTREYSMHPVGLLMDRDHQQEDGDWHKGTFSSVSPMPPISNMRSTLSLFLCLFAWICML